MAPKSSISRSSSSATLQLSPNVRRRHSRSARAEEAASPKAKAKASPKAKGSPKPKASPKAYKGVAKTKSSPNRAPRPLVYFVHHPDMVDSESDVEMSLEDRLYKRQCLIYRDWVDERDYNASYNCPPAETLVQAMNREMPRYGWIWDAVAREWTKP